MAHLIDKDALVAEIKRLIELFTIPQYSCEYNDAKADGFREFLSFINTLEVKEVDLEKEITMFSMSLAMKENNGDWEKDIAVTAKHFFELGLKVQKVKEVDTWHLQEKENIYDAVKGWDLYTFVCVMKDGTIQKFTGNLDEDCEGHINVHVDGVNDDYDNVDDIVKWIELT